MKEKAYNTILLEMQYLAPIQYYCQLQQHQAIHIEKWEHFAKASYRNRCYIAGPNGLLRLSIPLAKGKNQNTIIKDVRISYDYNWRHLHWQSLCSVYRRSPYFEYYEDRFAPFYEKKYQFLFDINEQLMHLILELLGITIHISYTKEFIKKPADNILDLRSAIHPKKQVSADFKPPKYRQVFEEKTGFLPNMSIVDLLFNEGPKAVLSDKSAFESLL